MPSVTDIAQDAGHVLQSAALVGNHLTGPVKAMLYCVDSPAWSITLSINPASVSLSRSPVTPAPPVRTRSPRPPTERRSGGSSGGGGDEDDVRRRLASVEEVDTDTGFDGETDTARAGDQLSFDTTLDASEPTGALATAASLAPTTFSAAGSATHLLSEIQALHRLALPGRTSATISTPRAPVVAFLWGPLQFTGYITNLQFNIDLFDPLGAPRRARVAIALSGRAFFVTDDATELVTEFQPDPPTFESSLFGHTTRYLGESARGVALRALNRLV